MTGIEVLCIEVPLEREARQVFDQASELLSAWPACASPLEVEHGEDGKSRIVYNEVAPTIVEAMKAIALGEEQTRVVALEVLDLLEAAHAREIVHPGIDPVALVVTYDPIESRPRGLLRGLGLPSGVRNAQDDVTDLARCLTRLYMPPGATPPAGMRWEETRLGAVLSRALGHPDQRFDSARAMREALMPPRSGKRVRQTTNTFASAGRVQSDLILASTASLTDPGAPAPVSRLGKTRMKATRMFVGAGVVAGVLLAFTLGRGSALDGAAAEAIPVVPVVTVIQAAPPAQVASPASAAATAPERSVASPVGGAPAPELVPAPTAPATVPQVASAPKAEAATTEARTRPAAKKTESDARRAAEPVRISEHGSTPPQPESALPAPLTMPKPEAETPAPAPERAASTASATAAPVQPPAAMAGVATPPAGPVITLAPTAPVAPKSDDAILSFGAGMNRPQRIAGRDPVYTRAARELKAEGAMIVRCIIERDGKAAGCRVLKSVPGMEDAVLEAFATHRYTPIIVDGRPARVSYTFNFRIEAP